METRITENDVMEAVKTILVWVGEDPEREGLKDTPKRVIKSYGELFAGYKQDPKDIITTFDNTKTVQAELVRPIKYDEMILCKGIEFSSFCEHHLIPFVGHAHIAYIPNQKIIGLSKLPRILEIYAKRLQIQENLTQQVTNCLMEHLQPKGAACVIEAKHLCVSCRGVNKQSSSMVTSSLEGVFRQPEVRAEFFQLIK